MNELRIAINTREWKTEIAYLIHHVWIEKFRIIFAIILQAGVGKGDRFPDSLRDALFEADAANIFACVRESHVSFVSE